MTDTDLAAILASTRAVLLDFDGPVTALLPPGPNAVLASATREPLYRFGVKVPENIATTSDHLAVVKFAADHCGPGVRHAVETIATLGEADAAQHSAPTPGAVEALRAFRATNRPVVIVSNNAGVAVQAYLHHHGLSDLVDGVSGRVLGRPDLMKPHPELVIKALDALGADPRDCLMIGDSVTDIEVSRRTGVRTIGYAKTPERGKELAAAGADVVIDDMATVASAVERHGPLPSWALMDQGAPQAARRPGLRAAQAPSSPRPNPYAPPSTTANPPRHDRSVGD